MKRLIPILCAAVFILTSCSGKNGNTSIADIVKNSPVEGEITIYCYDAQTYKAFLEKAAKGFQQKFPDTKVNIEVFGKMPEQKMMEFGDGSGGVMTFEYVDDPDAEKDYRYRVNTEIMSGGGADVCALDVLPVHIYQAGGTFDNLREYMDNDPDFDISRYRANIFDAMTTDTGMFVMPVFYTFFVFAYNKDLFTDEEAETLSKLNTAGYDELIALSKEAFDRQGGDTYIFGYTNSFRMASEMFSQNYDDFIDHKSKKANFTDGKFVGMLDKIREYEEAGYIESYRKQTDIWNEAEEPPASAFDSAEEWLETFRKYETEEYFITYHNSLSLYMLFIKDPATPRPVGVGNLAQGGIAGIKSADGGKASFSNRMSFGINENSGNKKTAWEFIKYLLSEEMQASDDLMMLTGHPINKDAFNKKEESQIKSLLKGSDYGLYESDQETADAYMALMDRYASQINTYGFHNQTVIDIVATEIEAYFAGEKTADEAARVLQSKLAIYLSE